MNCGINTISRCMTCTGICPGFKCWRLQTSAKERNLMIKYQGRKKTRWWCLAYSPTVSLSGISPRCIYHGICLPAVFSSGHKFRNYIDSFRTLHIFGWEWCSKISEETSDQIWKWAIWQAEAFCTVELLEKMPSVHLCEPPPLTTWAFFMLCLH